jgi:LacI family transcriptional regulator
VGVVVRQSSDTMAVEDPLVARAVRFIWEHACDPIQVKHVAARLPISRRYLEVRFRRLLGRSLHEEIRRVQLERAMRLLADTDLPIDRVAEAAGLSASSELSQAFRRQLGITPSQYRKQFPLPHHVVLP